MLNTDSLCHLLDRSEAVSFFSVQDNIMTREPERTTTAFVYNI